MFFIMGRKGKRHNNNSHKKTKNKKESEDSVEELNELVEGSKKCSHIKKAVKLGVLQNHVPHTKLGQCSFCVGAQSEDTGVCICLRCGKQGCDRYSEDQHGLSHYRDCPTHSITLHLQSMLVWCYTCDSEVPITPNTDLHECVKLIIKALKLNAPTDQKFTIPQLKGLDSTEKSDAYENSHLPLNANRKIKNLSQTELLHVAMAFVNQAQYSQQILDKNNLLKLTVQVTNPSGSLLVSLNKLLCEFRSSSPGPLSPKFLFSEICKKAPRFKGFQQQDSQELLRYLLDSVKTEQLKRVKIGVLKQFEVDEGDDIKNLPVDKKDKIKEYVNLVTAPSVDSVFAGRLDSIVICHQCHKESRVTESFLDLSLSLVQPQEPKVKEKPNKRSAFGKKNENSEQSSQTSESTMDKSPKQQTLSKHQQKVAKEAKRKKGKRKGKQRTLSRSTSEDDALETKQARESVENLSDDEEITIDTEMTSELEEAPEKELQDIKSQQETNSELEVEEKPKAAVATSEEVTRKSTGECENAGNTQENTQESIPQQSETNTTASNESQVQEEFDAKTHVEDAILNQMPDKISISQNDITSSPAPTSDVQDDVISTPMPASNVQNDVISTPMPEKSSDAQNDIISNPTPCDDSIEEVRAHTENCTEETTRIGHRVELEDATMERKASQSQQIKLGESANCDELTNEIFSKNESQCNSKTVMPVIQEEASISNEGIDSTTDPVLVNLRKIESNECSNDTKENPLDDDIEINGSCSSLVEESNNDCTSECIKQDEQCDHNSCKCQHSGESQMKTSYVNILGGGKVPSRTGVAAELNLDDEESPERTVKMEDVSNTQSGGMESGVKEDGREVDDNLPSLATEMDNFTIKDEATLKSNSKDEQNSDTREMGQNGCGVKENVRNLNGISPGKELNDQTCNGNIPELKDLTGSSIIIENSSKNCESGSTDDNNAKYGIDSDVMCDDENSTSSPRVFTIGPPYTPSSGECSVQSCLSQFCSPEVLEGKNKFACEECTKQCHEGREEHNGDDQESASDDDESCKGAMALKPTKTTRSLVYTEATKQLLISSTPPVLTLHFKRFQQVGFGLKKNPKHVDFLSVLDLAPFCSRGEKISADSQDQVLYSLIGVVEHSGGLNSGHYTACVKLKYKPTYNHLVNPSNIKDFTSFIDDLWKKDKKLRYTHERPGDGQWYYVSDSRVTTVTEEKVLRSQAYMLFYERLPLKEMVL